MLSSRCSASAGIAQRAPALKAGLPSAALARGCRTFDRARSAAPTLKPCRSLTQLSPAGHKQRGSRAHALSQDDDVSDYETAREQGLVKALLLAWFGSQGRSLFSAKCFVEVVVELYLCGYSLDDVKLAISMAGFAYGGKLLSPIHEDILLSWVAMVMMTLEAVGVEPTPEGLARLERRIGSDAAEGSSRMTQGLRTFTQQVIDMYLGGTDLYRLQLTQSMAGISPKVDSEEGQGPSPAVQVMQQNTKLVVITLEVIRGQGLATTTSLCPAAAPGSEDAAGEAAGRTSGAQFGPVGFVPSFLPPPLPNPYVPGTQPASIGAAALGAEAVAAAAGEGGTEAAAELKRAAAVRLLIVFMGGCMGWLYPAWDFIDSAADCYQLGWTADELFMQLNDEEFAQSGGVFPVGVAGMGAPERISASLFANWLALVFMTMAQMGVPHPGADRQLGWAWVCSLGQGDEPGPSVMQAHGVADFVSKTLRRLSREEEAEAAAAVGEQQPGDSLRKRLPGGGDGKRGRAAAEGAELTRAQRVQQLPQEGFAVIEDPALAKTSGFALLLSQQISLVQMTRQRLLAARADAAGSEAVTA